MGKPAHLPQEQCLDCSLPARGLVSGVLGCTHCGAPPPTSADGLGACLPFTSPGLGHTSHSRSQVTSVPEDAVLTMSPGPLHMLFLLPRMLFQLTAYPMTFLLPASPTKPYLGLGITSSRKPSPTPPCQDGSPHPWQHWSCCPRTVCYCVSVPSPPGTMNAQQLLCLMSE